MTPIFEVTLIIALKKLQSSPYTLLTLTSFACIGLYWTGLYGPLVLDDEVNLGFLFGTNLNIKIALSHLLSHSGPLGRPVAMASFMANAIFSQDLFYWKLTNLILHLVTGLLVYVFIKKIHTWPSTSKTPTLFAVAVTSIWLLHPLHVSTVLYTVQRMTQLAAVFTLSGLVCYLKARQQSINSKHFIVYQILAWLVFFPLAIFSKETALLFPAFVLVLELFLIQKDRVSNQGLLYILLGLLLIAYCVHLYKPNFVIGGYAVREFTLSERILTQARVMVRYLSMLLMPTQQQMAFLHDDIELSTGFFEPWTTASSSVLLALLLGSGFYFRKKHPLFSVGILFFFTGHLLESSIFPLELMYEHRNYLPSIGFFLAIANITVSIISEKRILTLLTTCFILLLSFTTWLRADIWSSNFRILYDLETNHPNSPRGAFIVSDVAIQIHDFSSARQKISPIHTLGAKIKYLYIDCIEYKELAESNFNIDIKPFRVTDNFAVMGLIDIANLGLNDECKFSFTAYLDLLDKILTNTRTWPLNRQKLLMYKAHYQWRLKQKEPAIDTLRQAFLLDQNNPVPLFLACEWALDENLKANADELCPKAFSVAEKTPYQYDELAEKVRKRFQPSHPVN